ncbi:MAG: hypothetical protein NT120_01765 [Candidatus Aenigmarchaeota archaeon]|nr:hypothetical protein [Candidatus Aenigmarchaeota archaeon]
MDPEKADGYDRILQDTQTTLLGKPLVHRRYGFCHPHKIMLIVDSKIVYEWDRIGETRTEFFFGEEIPARSYEEEQPCFIEYCQKASSLGHIPEETTFGDVDKLITQNYRKQLEKLLE